MGVYDTAHGSVLAAVPESVLVPVRALEPGRSPRGLRDPRARPWSHAGRDPQRPLRAQPDDTAPAATPAREPRPRPRDRQRHDRVGADDDELGLEGSAP